ncbi:hypothetical protein GCM10027088_06000 [Nocardia goodfellowii]
MLSGQQIAPPDHQYPRGSESTESVPAEARVCNLVPSRETERDWTFGDAVAVGTLGAVAALPQAVDLRRAWWTIGDQEDTDGPASGGRPGMG